MACKKYLLYYLLSLSSLGVAVANTPAKKPDPIMLHLRDAHAWHFTTIKHHRITLHLPVILYKKGSGVWVFSSKHLWNKHHQAVPYKGFILEQGKITALDRSAVYDISITKNVASMLLSVLILLILFLSMAQHYKRTQGMPQGGWMLLAYLINFIRNDVARTNIGEKHYKQFTPYLLTLFFFIWINNLMGLMPGAANVTGNISVTFVLALFTFFVTNLNASSYYWQHIFNPPNIAKWLLPIMVPIEVISLFTKVFTLTMRLFANMLAGHLVLLNIIGLIFILKTIFAIVTSLILGTLMVGIKIFVAFFQAYLFTLLSATYLGKAVATHG